MPDQDETQRQRAKASGKRFGAYLRGRRERGFAAEPETTELIGARAAGTSKAARPFKALARSFWELLEGHRITLGLALATLTVSSGLALVMPSALKVVIDYIWTDNPGPVGMQELLTPLGFSLPVNEAGEFDRVSMQWLLGVVMMIASLLAVVIGMWGRWQATKITKLVQASIRRRVFDHASNLPLHRVQSLKSGGVASILRNDAGGIADLIFSMVYNPWRAVVQLFGSLVILALVDWTMLAGAVALIPVMWLTQKTWISRIRPIYRDIRATRARIDAHATESFGGMRVVRGFNRSRGENQRFTAGNHYMARQEILAWWWSRILEVVWALMIPAASVGVILYGGSRVLDGTLTPGDVMMFVGYVGFLLGPLEALTASATNIQNNLAGLDKVTDLLEEDREFAGTDGTVQVQRPTARGDVRLEDVRFRYPSNKAADSDEPDEDVIKGVSLNVRAGQTVAFVGPSGSGKTTLCNLVARFYDPTAGRVMFDGVDLQTISPQSYRQLLGVVEQDVFLFDGTVAQNIAYAKRDASRADIERAAEAAAAHGFISELDRGYDTYIGERGVRLSGGQKQRLAIARAILADPVVLILDEATSNLDSESESLIQRSLLELTRSRTTFVIAHRLSTVRHADVIAVIEDGALIESGTHDELLALDARYAHYLRMQLDPTHFIESLESERAGQ